VSMAVHIVLLSESCPTGQWAARVWVPQVLLVAAVIG
jgi:hypothetical protein